MTADTSVRLEAAEARLGARSLPVPAPRDRSDPRYSACTILHFTNLHAAAVDRGCRLR